jgi:hypothetical protein
MMIEHRTTEVQLRIEKCAEILLNGHVDEIFPLFTPLEEKKWVQGWNPEFIFPKNGVAEEQMIFVTPPRFAGEDVYRWVMSKFRQEDHHVEYVVFTHDRIWNISVTCFPNGSTTCATIRYRFTAFTDRGHELNKLALSQMYQRELKDWQEAINEYVERQRNII